MSARRVANCIDAIGEAIDSANVAIGELERAKRELSAGVNGAGPVWGQLNTASKTLGELALELAVAMNAASNLLEGETRG